MSKRSLALLSLLLVAACSPPTPTDAVEEGLTIRAPIDLAPGTLITGHSPGGRRIAYVTPCDGSGPNELRLLDDFTGSILSLAPDVECFPNLVHFSPDGELAAFGTSGTIKLARPSTGAIVTVASSGGIGIDFSPDSSWFVVATASGAPVAATLQAWDADLVHHKKITDVAFYSPFAGGPFANLLFSPDSTQLLYLGQITPGFPIGTLALWTRGTNKTRTVATGVPATGYLVDESWTRIAYLRDATPPSGPPTGLPGNLAVAKLAGGAETIIGATQAGLPVAFAQGGSVVLYTDDGQAGGASTIKAYVLATAKSYTVDSGVFANLGRPSVTMSPRGDAVAYLTKWDPMIGGGELHLATVPQGPATPAPRVIAAHVVVNAYAFADGGGALVYLHDPNNTFPGAALGALSAFDVDQRITTAIASGVTQQSIKADPAREDVLYVDNYDGGQAAGDLESWNARNGQVHLVGHRAAIMSVATSPSGYNVGFLQLAKKGKPDEPPAVSLQLGRASGIGSASRVDGDVTSFVVGPAGRVVYTKSTGLWGAYVL